jgi:shikimate dehydrogenase
MSSNSPITGSTRIVGVWGHPVAHSRSPLMHNAALQSMGIPWVYVPFDVEPSQIREAVNGIRATKTVGINVTIPLKGAVIPFLDEIDEEAARIGSVNTIHNVEGVLHGYSTDGPGFLSALEALNWPVQGLNVYCVGAGGSAKAVSYALAARGNHLIIANRTRERAEELVGIINRYFPGTAEAAGWGEDVPAIDLIVNTSSLGMHPNEDQMPPISDLMLTSVQYVYDLIYAPPETKLLTAAKRAGCRVSNGLGMLARQGAISLAIWAGMPLDSIPVNLMEQSVRT